MAFKQNKKTVFILGAGASVPYGFPDGRKLRNNIINKFKQEVNKLIINKNELLDSTNLKKFNRRVEKFVTHFEKARTNIDLFITRRKGDYDELGIIAIFNEILKAERNCNFRTVKAEDDWLYWFFNNHTEGMLEVEKVKELTDLNYSFIIFNYDRVFERYFQTALMANWGRTAEVKSIINNVMNTLKIYHVYGSLGSLNWQNIHIPLVKFGDTLNYDEQLKFSQNISIMHNMRNNSSIGEMRGELEKADRVFFLGFAFARENLQYLNIPEVFQNRDVSIYATAYGYSDTEIRRIKMKLIPQKNRHNQLEVKNTYCLSLLKDYLFDS